MPATITLQNLGWSTPDGRDLFTNLDLSFGDERTGLVGRNGVGKTTLLRLVTGELTPQTGTVTRDGRLAVLRQSVRPGPDETVADLFGASAGLGYIMLHANARTQTALMFAALLTLAAIAVCLYYAVDWAVGRAMRWQRESNPTDDPLRS